jgi:catechol 2,3-dioxygenase-like lactoylglutathione lyase family enzyme
MKVLGLAIVVHVSNLDAAIKYYTDILGFNIDFKLDDYAGVLYDDVLIHLNGPSNRGIKKIPGNAHFCVDCDEIDDYYKLIGTKGALIKIPLDDRTYGVRDCAVNDPDGNTIVFGKALSIG